MRIERSGAFNVKWNYILKHRCKNHDYLLLSREIINARVATYDFMHVFA